MPRFLITSDASFMRFMDEMERMFAKKRCVIVDAEVAQLANNKQKAMLKIWMRKVAAHLLKKSERDVTGDEMERMSRSIKKRYYSETGEGFMVKTQGDPFHPDREKVEVTSSSKWSVAEISRVMDWLQATAASDYDLILESKGDHQEMKREANK